MKTAVVTGAAQGVGLATAQMLARSGYHVVLTDRQPLEPLVDRLREEGLSAEGINGNIASADFIAELAACIAASDGAADVLVNNAGISCIAPAETTSLEQWQSVMAVNLQGPFLLSQAFGRQMLARGSGSIVNVASIAGLGGVIHRAAYKDRKSVV